MSVANRMKGALDIASSLALVAAAGAFIWVQFFKTPTPQPPKQVTSVSGLQIKAARATHVTGRASIAIVEFADFQCPFCAKHVQDTLPALTRELIAPGKVLQYVALHYPIEAIHPHALEASEAAECAARQGRFWEMHRQLFRDPNSVANASFADHARAIGLDESAFEQCLASNDTLDEIRADQAEGKRLGVTGTPSFFLGVVRPDGSIDLRTRISGTVSVEVFAAQIAKLRS
jgi:protein-disulfide isomerase